ncbi:hypothetical protein QAD02_006499 [Eretmocerus hayati]|uniref:Uncharacterized protein n=1 Tax=Eretmocerus hayati TaxID=131215 RepID=A0ACC2N1E2_9HYME|nr:hypothetical protein QAD02_006499 [Eretmocerus hayati]
MNTQISLTHTKFAMSSDNRGHASSSTNVNNQVIPAQTSKPTFAKVYANTLRPKREHAIIIDSKEGLTNDDYLDGLETLIALSEVRGISKISGGRVCIYVSSAEWVTEEKESTSEGIPSSNQTTDK